ncbi:hypothetical protein G6F31_019432 [Rhizopus arrhizus]|nr:hypothetical protein G6F31_019432 [Rhizopus arrhizus]
MDHIAGRIDAVTGGRRAEDIAGQIDLDQAGRGDFVIHHAVGVDQQVIVRAGDARGDMVVDQVAHSEVRHQPVAGGQLDAGVPFLRAHVVASVHGRRVLFSRWL